MRALTLIALLAVVSTGCGAVQKAASEDPVRCERDPSCKRHQDKTRDCAVQCADDPACMDRCREISGQKW